EGLLRLDILDAQRKQSLAQIGCPFDFASDLRRVVGVAAEHQDKDLGSADRIDDRCCPILSWPDVAGCDPAANPPGLKGGADGIGGGLVQRGMTDEHVMGHWRHHSHLVALKIYRWQIAR